MSPKKKSQKHATESINIRLESWANKARVYTLGLADLTELAVARSNIIARGGDTSLIEVEMMALIKEIEGEKS